MPGGNRPNTKSVNPFVKASQLKTKIPGYAVARMHALNLYLVSGDVGRTLRAGEHFTLAPTEVVDSATGQKKELIPSSFKQAPEFRRASAEEVSLLEVASVYRLPEAKLAPGTFHLGTFSYRDGVERNDAAILTNDHDTFLLVGKLKKPLFVGMEIDSQIIAEAAGEGEEAEAGFESLF